MGAKLWGEARNHLSKALAQRPSDRVYRLLAELAEAEHGDIAAARDWLAKAANAEPDPIWICKECGTLSKSWRSNCGHCGAFDSMEWKPPSIAVQIDEPNRLPPAPPPAEPPASPDDDVEQEASASTAPDHAGSSAGCDKLKRGWGRHNVPVAGMILPPVFLLPDQGQVSGRSIPSDFYQLFAG